MSVQGPFPVRQRIFQLVRHFFSPILALYYNAFLIACFLFLSQLNYVNICNHHSSKVYNVFHGTCEVINLYIRFVENFSQKEGATAIKSRNNICTILYWLHKKKTSKKLITYFTYAFQSFKSFKVYGLSRPIFLLVLMLYFQ